MEPILTHPYDPLPFGGRWAVDKIPLSKKRYVPYPTKSVHRSLRRFYTKPVIDFSSVAFAPSDSEDEEIEESIVDEKPIVPEKKRYAVGKLSFPYPTEYGDHFETTTEALNDIAPVLRHIAHVKGMKPNDLKIYDPYYCNGTVIQRWKELGYGNVFNKERDFYEDLVSGHIPDYDVLVTNPPYSGEHKQKCLKFCIESGKPWAVLLPNYISNRDYFKKEVEKANYKPFMLVPKNRRYEFDHPEGTGHDTSPFEGYWFVGMGSGRETDAAFNNYVHVIATERPKEFCIAVKNSEELSKRRLVHSEKRKNPKRRRKEQAKFK